MFSIIETTPLSAIHFLIILPQSVNRVINPLTPTNDQDNFSLYYQNNIKQTGDENEEKISVKGLL